MTKRTITLFNAFCKSYRLRYVVHAAKPGADTTLCGREIYHKSRARFDEKADRVCERCLKSLEIERRIHPGWDD